MPAFSSVPGAQSAGAVDVSDAEPPPLEELDEPAATAAATPLSIQPATQGRAGVPNLEAALEGLDLDDLLTRLEAEHAGNGSSANGTSANGSANGHANGVGH